MNHVRKSLLLAALGLCLSASASLACVGKTLVVGAEPTPRGRFVAQILAILINERTGTTVKVADFSSDEALHRALAAGEVDIAVEYTTRALGRLGMEAPPSSEEALRLVKAAYLEKLNLTWLQPLGLTQPSDPPGVGAPVVRKDTVKKFPALPRLIAKTEGLLTDSLVSSLVSSGDQAKAAREFLRGKKLI